MLKNIIKKEILEAILSLRFLIASLLCLVLIPLGVYVNLKDYEQRLSDYQEAVRLYQQKSQDKSQWWLYDFPVEGYRPPSILSIFSVGLEYFLPNKVVTSLGGEVSTSNETGVNNPQSLLFGKVDLLFNVSFIISLLALIFTFSTITGEKEDGTMRLVMSNPVPRWQILLGKIVGNYVVLLVPFLLSLLIALLVLNVSDIVPIFSVRILPSFLVIIFMTLLFILSMFNLGILVSTLMHRSITSIVTLLFVWTVLGLSVPKLGPMIAEIIYPVKSQQVFNLQKLLIRENLDRELHKKRGELWGKLATKYTLDQNRVFSSGETETEKKMLARYNEEKKVIEYSYEQRVNEEIRKLEQEYINQRKTQALIAMNISRISPLSCYSYLISNITGTGFLEIDKFEENVKRFQNVLKENIYDKIIVSWYEGPDLNYTRNLNYAEGFDPKKASIPQLNYQHTTLNEALQAEWVDILLLFLFNVVFFAVSYVSFLRYDVR